MNHIELLSLIAKGETEDLLMQKNLTRRLNALAAFGLIDICEGKILITPKGRQIQNKSNLKQIETLRVQEEQKDFSPTTLKRNTVYVYLSLVLLCTAVVFLFVFILRGN